MAVTELWESQEAMEAFLNAHVYPMAQAAGLTPELPMVATIHNMVIAGK
jgi:heme-degrading monooxygenase HmoA